MSGELDEKVVVPILEITKLNSPSLQMRWEKRVFT